MCGLILDIETGSRSTPLSDFRTALSRIRHRGPDSEGIVGIAANGERCDDSAHAASLMGFRRLSIIDLTCDADQPMMCPETGNIVLFNGEIYNFLELRSELEKAGLAFRTQSDTEVVLNAYRLWGSKAFERFNGMWGIVIYDRTKRQFVVSRDRMGVKPLYFCCTNDRVVFASEIRSIMALTGQPAVNSRVVFDFFALIRTELSDETFFDGIEAVPAGALWHVGMDGAITRSRFHNWNYDENSGEPLDRAARSLEQLVDDAVRLRLRSDAKSVTLLSGGLDSSIVTFVASKYGNNQTRTNFVGAFTYGYDQPAFSEHDETQAASDFLQQFPNNLKHVIRRYSPRPGVDELLALTVAQEQPFNTPSVLAGCRLARAIRREGIRVALSGEGADELFGGYTRVYLSMQVRACLRSGRIGEAVRLLLAGRVKAAHVMNRLVWDLPAPALRHMHRALRPNIALLAEDFWSAYKNRFDNAVDFNTMAPNRRMQSDVVRTNVPEILRLSDHNSMDASIEMRHPYMDYRVVQFALNLPCSYKIGATGGKLILRRAFERVLPTAVVNRPKLRGFGNAEQFQVASLDLSSLVERVPPETWNYLDRKRTVRVLRGSHVHPSAWLPVSFCLWMIAVEEKRLCESNGRDASSSPTVLTALA